MGRIVKRPIPMKDRMHDRGTPECQDAELVGVLPQMADSLSAARLVVQRIFAVICGRLSDHVNDYHKLATTIVLLGGLSVFALATLPPAAFPSFASPLMTRVVAALMAGLVAPVP
jgi:MFS family permease